MPDYKETTATGVAWQRCHTVTAHNPLDGQPRVEFQEEKIVVLDGEPIRQWAPGCSVDFAPDAAVPLLDPGLTPVQQKLNGPWCAPSATLCSPHRTGHSYQTCR